MKEWTTRCGTCGWFRAEAPEFGTCRFVPTPDSVQAKILMHGHDGDSCPCWRRDVKKEEVKPKSISQALRQIDAALVEIRDVCRDVANRPDIPDYADRDHYDRQEAIKFMAPPEPTKDR
jgi:hypothetical protein